MNKVDLMKIRALYIGFLLLVSLTAMAQDAAPAKPKIVIAGDVYGGGKEGAIGTGNTVDVTTASEATALNKPHLVKDANNREPGTEGYVTTYEAGYTPVSATAADEVKLKGDIPVDASNVVINSGTVRTVYGGGQNGRTYGNTNVTVRGKDTQIGLEELKNTVHGGLFGAGDGALAYVFGNSHVKIEGGYIIQKVYGGGNQADLMGHTMVELLGGNIRARGVFGGARMADVCGYSHVLIDGANLKNDLLVNHVYGGNDVAGKIAPSETWDWTKLASPNMVRPFKPLADGVVDNTWNAFVRITNPDKKDDAGNDIGKKIYIGQLFGGGNGDYAYTDNGTKVSIPLKEWNYATNQYDVSEKTFTVEGTPTLPKTYLEVGGGSIVYAYGGGNNATVTEKTVICVDNPSAVVYSMLDADGNELLTDARFKEMGINLTSSSPDSPEYQIGSFYGGNNKAEMAIRPTWDLRNGKIRNVYSGGNAGNMTYEKGLLLLLASSGMKIDNVFGGCRRANVDPAGVTEKSELEEETITVAGKEYTFPEGYAARLLILAGDINNVYGGNDISGTVKFGNAVGIHSNINGDVYGGGNGSYVYTDNPKLAEDDEYYDFYYAKGDNSVEALNAFRPNAESVSIHVDGTAEKKTLIGGAVYCGGNSATLTGGGSNTAELKLGRHVVAENVFLGNNGENMVDPKIIKAYISGTKGTEKLSSMDLTNAAIFADYMKGVGMGISPQVSFDAYDGVGDYDTYIGSYYCGGNVGSMSAPGTFNQLNFNQPAVVYDKIVAGCNNADVDEIKDTDGSVIITPHYQGGLLTAPTSETLPKVRLNLSGVKLMPMKLVKDAKGKAVLGTDGNPQLTWNAIDADGNAVTDFSTMDPDRRLLGANVYGGCYNSGHINGSVEININETLVEREKIFAQIEERPKLYSEPDEFPYTLKAGGVVNSGVILDEQGMDVLGSALNVYGGGYGKDSEIWGGTTVNLKKGYTFQIFGGGEAGAIGKKKTDTAGNPVKDDKGNYVYEYNAANSTCINLNGPIAGVARNAEGDSPNMAECEFIYGGGFEGPIAGNTRINLGNGRIFNSFAGSCYADIQGHTETYVGLNSSSDTDLGFPWIRDHIYGGNDLGGLIRGTADFTSRISDVAKSKIYSADSPKASAYMEYLQGRVENIFGGCFGDYDYKTEFSYINQKPEMERAFVNFKPRAYSKNFVQTIFGAGEGFDGERDGDKMQNGSYVLIDIPDDSKNFAAVQIFGAGSFDGLGMREYVAPNANPSSAELTTLNEHSAVIDLIRGQIGAVYGGSYNEGVTRRTMVNVPKGSTIRVGSIFGGAYGTNTYMPCDVYEANVEYHSGDAVLVCDNVNAWNKGMIYGGNNNERRTLYGRINIDVPVRQDHYKYGMTTGTVYGAGCGKNTWSEYTEVNLNSGAQVYEVYGGGQDGKVFNAESIQQFMKSYKPTTWPEGTPRAGEAFTDADWKTAWSLGGGLDTPSGKEYWENTLTNLANPLVRVAEVDDRDFSELTDADKAFVQNRYCANVLIKKGATVGNYAYGGGYGTDAVVSGTTYIALLGGTVSKDIYAAGTSGSVEDVHSAAAYSSGNRAGFMASANAYVQGGTVRNVYGGGWRGSVGHHDGDIDTGTASDVLGESHVIIGDLDGTSFFDGIPAIMRNVYGGGEGGGIFGTAYVTINNGRIGYRYENGDYVEELDDVKAGDNLLDRSGNVFGGGYVANSYVDISDVKMYGGQVRGGLYGGGEVGPIGRGTVKEGASTTNAIIVNGDAKIYKGGETHVTLYNGNVLRDVFGGGRGFDNWGGEGWMSEDEKKTMDLSSKGYVFGKTEVRILGGKVGTEEGVADGYGNVFGGGNIGFVYSAEGKKSADDGYYYKAGILTEDCSVLVAPYCQVKSPVTINGTNYAVGQYVPIDDLNTLSNKNKDARWASLDIEGVTVCNAVFAGGNISEGNDILYANTKTVLGNVTASIVDVYNRDLVTVGTEHVGGLYGDGNLTLVDGYRELNITNYGTDYYGMSDNISLEDYYKLTDRERAYFELKYKCIKAYEYTNPETHQTKIYNVGESISEETYNALEPAYQSNWEQAGFCSIYAGRLMNTIQRADFAGIFGSRMVLQGAKDRVPNVADKNDYTVNRVREVSLNQVKSKAGDTGSEASHGNYFGIYNIVNYMGALTSDVNFYNNVRETNNDSYAADGTTTYYQWKEDKAGKRERNNGTSPNSVALASGVYLELTTEKSTGNSAEEKDWGYITGVAQLELINVKTGLGGGYVYAKNEHGVRMLSGKTQVTLSKYNANAVTNKMFVYNESTLKEVQTSGNFIHNLKQIVDDCYPTTNAYSGENAAPAHYWYIRGTSYVYDQYVTAYTGITNAYSEVQNIPLNINAASYGRIKIEEIQPNLYAYYATTEAEAGTRTPLQNTDENADNYSVLINNEKTYYLNDPITYWDYIQLNESDQRHFVRETYVTVVPCVVAGVEHPAGEVLLPAQYEALKAANPTVYLPARDEEVDFDYAFRLSNNLTHGKGYVVSYSVNNPQAWDSGETDATYSPNQTGVYGQHDYTVGDIINKDLYNEGLSVKSYVDPSTQANMVRCYVVTEDVTFTYGGKNYRYVAGSPIVKEDFDATTWSSLGTKVQEAQLVISTLEFTGPQASKTVLYGDLIWPARFNELVEAYQAENGVTAAQAREAVSQHLKDAYYCQKEGLWGGGYFEAGTKYSALKGWASLSPEDREHFHFNYDALNLLVDPDYTNNIPLYDGTRTPLVYSVPQAVDYDATYRGKSSMTYTDNNGASKTVTPGQVLKREDFENMPNEQYHYSPITVTVDNQALCYVVRVAFTRGDTPYSVGQVLSSDEYSYLGEDQKAYIDELEFTTADINKTYYYCRDAYQVNVHNGTAVTDVLTGTKIDKGGSVQVGMLLTAENYATLPNQQKNFSISGTSPEETTTLYVARGSDIFDLQKDRVITVIFSYEYTESDESGQHIEPISERHIMNIHLHFESGVPTVDQLLTPQAALPGDFVSLIQPKVQPGAYELLGGGWEIFDNEDDAERHRNGTPFDNTTPVYWYQDGQYLAYYAKTYLGKTYSNYVQFSVANYHDLKSIMDDTEHHLYVDHPDVKRDSKIYINNYGSGTQDGLDLLSDFFKLSTGGTVAGHAPLNSHVKNASNLEFFLHSDIDHTGKAWTPIGSAANCFEGTFHGDGYTLSGMDNSLFGTLCGEVYNLGVSGSFTGGGVADAGKGYVENSWVKTTGTPAAGTYAIIGNPMRSGSEKPIQIENCYYLAPGNYASSSSAHGLARKMTEEQFYAGEVAYDLNGFYLKKRYNDQETDVSKKIDTNDYVKYRFADGDFIYAGGEIPTSDDVRMQIDKDGNRSFEPIWPDDYLFFGQRLSYDQITYAHDATPSHLDKDGDCATLNVNITSNRVFRAPGYYGDKTMSRVHFNPYAVFAVKSSVTGQKLTAVDFTGYQDKTYTKDYAADGLFFGPILDPYIELAGVMNADLTRNLVIYSPSGETNATRTVLANYFKEPEMYEKEDDAATGMKAAYRAVEALSDVDIDGIHGHMSVWNGTGFTAETDHVLVDKNDFDVPIKYTLASDKRMWYQRDPILYVSKDTNGKSYGWEDIALPFSAELVTTPDKGEITHFFGNSTKGHEYWLREFRGMSSTTGDEAKATLRYPDVKAGNTKVYTNTFLWDYYYEANGGLDENKDEYQDYYNKSHSYADYPMELACVPYIIGMPGANYYEFDLSGQFVPQFTSASAPEQLPAQSIIFGSKAGITIGITGDETMAAASTYTRDGYVFHPNFQTTDVTNAYVMDVVKGDKYTKQASATVLPFRTYFTAPASARTRSILFDDDDSELRGDEELAPDSRYEDIKIYTGRHKIIVESKLQRTVDVRILNPAGITMTTFTLEPGETVETRIINQGVYIVQTADARYTKKVAVR